MIYLQPEGDCMSLTEADLWHRERKTVEKAAQIYQLRNDCAASFVTTAFFNCCQ